MEPSKQCLDFIKSFEAFRANAYYCPGGKLTIGYGTTAGVRLGDTITEEVAIQKLKADVSSAAATIKALVHAPLNQNQFDALVSFVYNVGAGNFSKSTLLRRINDGRWEIVPEEFKRWIYVNGQPSKGLIKRRTSEAGLFTKPIDSE